MNCLHKVEDVVGAVHEEAGDHGVQAPHVLRLVVHVQEIPGCHREPNQFITEKVSLGLILMKNFI